MITMVRAHLVAGMFSLLRACVPCLYFTRKDDGCRKVGIPPGMDGSVWSYQCFLPGIFETNFGGSKYIYIYR